MNIQPWLQYDHTLYIAVTTHTHNARRLRLHNGTLCDNIITYSTYCN